MELNENEKLMLEKMGGVGMKIAECAAMLEIDVMTFKAQMKDKDSDTFKAYAKGFLGSKIKLGESVAEVAYRGSGPAQKMLNDMINGADIEFE